MAETVGVIGAGGWGTAIAKVLAELGHEVCLWCREPRLAEEIRERRTNSAYLPGVVLPAGIAPESDPLAAASGRSVLVLALPSPYLMGSLRGILAAPNVMDGESLVVVVTKGFIPGPRGPRLILDALEDRLPGRYRDQLVYLSGPSHAEEVARGRVTGLVAASANGRNAIRVRELFRGSRVLVFPSLDSVGVQVCAAAKNVIAIAFGMLDAFATAAGADQAESAAAAAPLGPAGGLPAEGLPAEGLFGDNTESLLLAAGLNEMQILGRALGASHPETFSSLAGVGDLDVTCRSIHGRNRRFGREIVGKGILEPFAGIGDLVSRIGEIGYLPEGAAAAAQIRAVAVERRLDLPIMEGVYRILNREVEPLEFLESYLGSLGARMGDLPEGGGESR
ncbi:MAG: NAD(P)-dependent glycerol-3-phosphate dehydrogenase [Spirochaetaceae bacterium]|nr:NAD(P)-dependent glycerol-3-phosphate dehydrogenase [Spirochaetaceae bacterium]